MNLHRVAPAHGDVGSPFSRQMDEVAFTAGTASLTWMGSVDLRAIVSPHIERKQSSPHLFLRSDQHLQRLGGSDGGGKVHSRIQYAGGFARLHRAPGCIREDAGEARCFSR